MMDASSDTVRQIREKAERARYHAAMLDDQKTKANLISYAEQLEAEILELNPRIGLESSNS